MIKTKKGIVNGEGSKYPDADSEDERHRDIIVEADRLSLGRDQLKGKTGIRAPDIAAIFFIDAWGPKENLISEEGKGFHYFMKFFNR